PATGSGRPRPAARGAARLSRTRPSRRRAWRGGPAPRGRRLRTAREPGRRERWWKGRGLPGSSSVLGVDGDDAACFEPLLPFPVADYEAPLLGGPSHRDVEPCDVANRAEGHQVPRLVLDEIDR